MRIKKTGWAVLAAAALTLVEGLVNAVGATTPEKDELNAPDVKGIQRRVAPNEVVVGGQSIFRVPTGAGGLSAAERADIISDRLEDVMAHYVVGAGSVQIKETAPDMFVIAISGEPLVTVEAQTAKAAGADNAESLATTWAERLRTALPALRATRQVASARN